MKFAALCVLVAAYLAAPCYSEPFIMELPGYAKAVMGGYGNLSTSWYEPRKPFYSFRYFHYAAKPTYETRFLPPVPSNYPYPDEEIYNSIDLPPGCAQGGDNALEDCLILSVYTPMFPGNASDPNTSYDNLLPVMVWIHGGSFAYGQSIIYEPNTFMAHDVVMVVIQYRLGALGYLCLDTDEIPGNAGMADQIEALRWVQKFIKYFGGDKDKVTIVGESAGAASVGFLLLAPQAKEEGLFRYAIAESGSMLTDWALDRNASKHGYRIAELTGCPLEPYADLLHCLRTIDPLELRRAQSSFSNEDERNGGLGFGGQSPVIQVAGKEKYLTAEPRQLIESGQYMTEAHILFGANEGEGIMAFDMMLDGYIQPNNLMDSEDFFKFDVVRVILGALSVRDDTSALSDALISKYLGYAVDSCQMGNYTAMINGLIDICGALFLKAGGWQTVMLHTKFNPHAYWYSFDFFGKVSLIGADETLPRGVMHADEIMYLFTMPIPHNETEVDLSRKMIEVWTTFATYGEPTPEGVQMREGIPKWPPYTHEKKEFMAINKYWSVKNDYSLYYTVTVDKAGPRAVDPETAKECANAYWKSKKERRH
ncbi:Carboxylic ester hydrolase [Daphnia magna]|uniref:Carboxylic ester hydrolase n=1 Tax=Daphnia magna TaxID=35525 RepID=A0A0N8CDV0_9CRUS|nr:Carboxylic ester hydrolase [Daphnia magna]